VTRSEKIEYLAALKERLVRDARVWLIGLCILTACSRDNIITYQFQTGQHFAKPYLVHPVSGAVTYDFCIHADTYYEVLPYGEEGDWNKMGYIYEGIHPHLDNSFTLVWKWEGIPPDRQLKIGWYGWQRIQGRMVNPQQKTSQCDVIGTIQSDTWYQVTIYLGDVVIEFNGNRIETTLRCDGKFWLPPYFGGQATSPNNGHISFRYY
jgi:hypothetical protein